jgi:RNA polymerase sigma-70 factor (ECF subfamily)
MINEAPGEKLNDETFGKAVLDYKERIFLVILRFVRNRDDAKDLTQETFVKAYSSRHQFRGDSSLYTWLYRIAVNLSLNYKSRSRVSVLSSIDDSLELVADGNPSDTILTGELGKHIDSAVGQLPARQRMVFLMRYYEDKPHAEIANILGITEGAVKANYHQAVKKLRVQLAPYIEGEKE